MCSTLCSLDGAASSGLLPDAVCTGEAAIQKPSHDLKHDQAGWCSTIVAEVCERALGLSAFDNCGPAVITGCALLPCSTWHQVSPAAGWTPPHSTKWGCIAMTASHAMPLHLHGLVGSPFRAFCLCAGTVGSAGEGS